MTELEILHKRFGDLSGEYPGLTHVLSVWSEGVDEPKINPKYTPTQDNLLVIYGDGITRTTLTAENRKHWLIKPSHESWDINQIRGKFQNLAENAGRILWEKELLAQLELPEHLSRLSEYELGNSQMAQLWVLVVRELGNSKRYICDWRDSKAVWKHAVGQDDSIKDPNYGYYEIQEDFFYASFSVISRLLEKAATHVTTITSKPLLSDRQIEVL